MPDWTTATVAIVSIVTSNGIVLWRDLDKKKTDAREDWRATTGQAYFEATLSLRHYIYWISNVALAYAREAAGSEPHFVSKEDADRNFGNASIEVTAAGEKVDQFGSIEVRTLFEVAREKANELVKLKARGSFPDDSREDWYEAHDIYTAAFRALKERIELERKRNGSPQAMSAGS